MLRNDTSCSIFTILADSALCYEPMTLLERNRWRGWRVFCPRARFLFNIQGISLHTVPHISLSLSLCLCLSLSLSLSLSLISYL